MTSSPDGTAINEYSARRRMEFSGSAQEQGFKAKLKLMILFLSVNSVGMAVPGVVPAVWDLPWNSASEVSASES